MLTFSTYSTGESGGDHFIECDQVIETIASLQGKDDKHRRTKWGQ